MKRITIALFSFITLPTAIQANIDPKVAEMCMKATDFQGCVQSMSGQKNNEPNAEELYNKALENFDSADSLNAIKFINQHLKKNPNSKKGYSLRALIYIYDFSEFEKALDDLDKAIEIDNNYAYAYALKGELLYFDLGGSFSQSIKYIKKAISLAPNDPHVNFIAGDVLVDNAYVHLDKDKKDLALKYFNRAQTFLGNSIEYSDLISSKNIAAEHTFPLGFKYSLKTILGDTKFELFFLYEDKKQRDLSKKYLKETIDLYTMAIKMAPTQEEVEKIESDRDLDLVSPAEIYNARGNAYSFGKKWSSACKDWKVSKKYGNKDAQKNYRDFC